MHHLKAIMSSLISCKVSDQHSQRSTLLLNLSVILQLDVKLQVEYMSFSAHADAKGIMQLIRMAEPRNMLLVHGEAVKMEFLKGKIEQEFSECRPSAHQ